MKALKKLIRILFLLYPVLVFVLVKNGWQWAATIFASFFLLSQVHWKSKKVAGLELGALAALSGLLFVVKPENFIRLGPFAISLSFLALFYRSLSQEKSILEIYTGWIKRVSPEESRYLKSLTQFWVIYLALNSLVLGILTFWGSLEIWMLYSNVLFYVITGSFIGISIVIGRLKLRRPRSAFAQKIIVGSGFIFFGFFALLYSALVPLLCLLLLGQRKLIQKASQSIVRNFFRVFLFYLRCIRGCRIKVIDYRQFKERPQLIVCTHVSMFDVLIMLAHFPNSTTFVKAKFCANPFLKFIIWASGFVPVDDRSPDRNHLAVEQATAALQAGQSFIVFPEGTRSENGQLGVFKSGSFHLAFSAGSSITPVLFTSSAGFFTGKKSVFAPQKGMVDIHAHIFDPIRVNKMEDAVLRRQAGRKLKEEMKDYFVDKQKEFAFEWNKPKRLINNLGSRIEVIKIDAESILAEFSIEKDHPHFEGHFLKFPVLPAISQIHALQLILSESLGAPIEITGIKRAKFLNLIQPGLKLQCSLKIQAEGTAEWTLQENQNLYSKGLLKYERRSP